MPCYVPLGSNDKKQYIDIPFGCNFFLKYFVSTFIETHLEGQVYTCLLSLFSVFSACFIFFLFTPKTDFPWHISWSQAVCGASSTSFGLVSPAKDLEKVQAVYLEHDSGKFHQCGRRSAGGRGREAREQSQVVTASNFPQWARNSPRFVSSP